MPEIPTAEEQGYPVYSSNLQYWWFPKGADPGVINYMAGVLENAIETEYVKRRSAELEVDPRIIVGQELEDRIERKMSLFSEMKTENRLDLPDLTFWAIVSALGFGAALLRKSLRSSSEASSEAEAVRLRYDLAFGVAGMCAVYVLLMGMGILGFVWATILFLVASGLYLTNCDKRRVAYVLEMALLLSFGLHFVFTQVFAIQLP